MAFGTGDRQRLAKAIAGIPWPPIGVDLSLGPQQVVLLYGTEADTKRAYAALSTHQQGGK